MAKLFSALDLLRPLFNASAKPSLVSASASSLGIALELFWQVEILDIQYPLIDVSVQSSGANDVTAGKFADC